MRRKRSSGISGGGSSPRDSDIVATEESPLSTSAQPGASPSLSSEQIKRIIKELNKSIRLMAETVKEFHKELKKIQRRLDKLGHQTTSLQQHKTLGEIMRDKGDSKFKLVIHGLKCEGSVANTTHVVKDFCIDKLNVPVSFSWAASMGQKVGATPILVQMDSLLDNKIVCKNCFKLKGESISVQHYLTKEERINVRGMMPLIHRLKKDDKNFNYEGQIYSLKEYCLLVKIPSLL